MPDRHGPLKTGRFAVEIDDEDVSGFKKVDIPDQRTKLVEYREGTDAAHNRKLWGQNEYDDLRMTRGAKKDDKTLFDWRQKVVQGKMEEARKNLAVILQDEQASQQLRWEFTNAWIKEYVPPTLETSAQGGEAGIATEEIVVCFDEMKRTA
jgi:phage tail-like protein